MGPAGTGPATAADAEVLRLVDAEAQKRLWSRDARRRVAGAWVEAGADPHSIEGDTTVSPEKVAAAVAVVVAEALQREHAPLVPDPADAGSEDAADLPVGSRPPSQLGFAQLSDILARRVLRGGGKR
ncbi:hypothetical protein FE697_011680 [Mumia zhuanghuii]|uniref:Uncharacterized protein n=2 Tax=Mumia TaxID=1546255 RepID=A0ABW1QGF2_9ACTN|nr:MULTISPECIES: hypothetical protein [Mumia]KAA1422809.1 hypothetical protein FE697_011680 [Mumia zhuanghuii]